MLYLAPYAGCAMGEYFMDKGEDALIAVSYTHLDVYKRQRECSRGERAGTEEEAVMAAGRKNGNRYGRKKMCIRDRSWTMPRSPCRAFRESSRTVGVPVDRIKEYQNAWEATMKDQHPDLLESILRAKDRCV